MIIVHFGRMRKKPSKDTAGDTEKKIEAHMKKPYHIHEWIMNLKGERLAVTKVPMLDDERNVKFVVPSAHDVTDLEEARNTVSSPTRSRTCSTV